MCEVVASVKWPVMRLLEVAWGVKVGNWRVEQVSNKSRHTLPSENIHKDWPSDQLKIFADYGKEIWCHSTQGIRKMEKIKIS